MDKKLIIIIFTILLFLIILVRIITFNCYYFLHKYYFWEKSSDDIEIIGKYNLDPLQKKIISVSLFGTNPIYFDGAMRMKRDLPKVFPGWELRIYMHYKVDPEIINKFLKTGAQVFIVKQDNVTPSDCTFWRFLAAGDDVIFLSRDVDYILNGYDYWMAERWIEAGTTKFCKYIFYDHSKFFYGVGLKMIGNNLFHAGRWGGRDRCVPDILMRINKFKKRRHWHSDEVFLQTIINDEYIKKEGITVYLEENDKNFEEYFGDDYIDLEVVPDYYNLKKYDIAENSQKKINKIFEYFS